MNVKKLLRQKDGNVAFATAFIIVVFVMLTSFLLLFASVKIHCINIKNSVKTELNNLTASIYKDTFRSQRESNLNSYISTLYSGNSYTQQLKQDFIAGLANKMELSNRDYRIQNINLEFRQDGDDKIEYIFTCDAEFYILMFGKSYPTVTRHITLTAHHNTKF